MRRAARSEEHTSELQSHSDLHSFPTRRSSDLASNSGYLASLGLTGVRRGLTAEPELRAACADAACGISSADYALSDTGTLVMFSSAEEARFISLLPPVHIAIVPAERILSGHDCD